MPRRATRPSACVGTCPSRRSSSRSSTPSECARPNRGGAACTPGCRVATAAASGPRRRNALEPNGHQPRSGRRRGRGRFPHRVRSLRPGCRARAEGARGSARSARPQAQVARSLFHVGQQGLVPQSGPGAARRHRPRRRSRLEQGRHHGPPDLPRRALVHGSDDGWRSRRRRSRSRRFAARSRVRRRIGRRGGRGEHGSRSEPRELGRPSGA